MIIELKPNETALEIGCGLHKVLGDASIGIDKSPNSVADIIRDVAKRGIPCDSDKFDKVLSFDVIEHIEQYDDLVFFINEIWRVLKPGGEWCFSTPNGINSFRHMTHVRMFTDGSFCYLAPFVDNETEHMRISDGIKARFSIQWDGTNNESDLMGRFIAIK